MVLPLRLDGRTALVTGAGSAGGIGMACARALRSQSLVVDGGNSVLEAR
jgi:NAD(P)-dependent dehydrogenase (short-subunit alcohol dehydrogenase family)